MIPIEDEYGYPWLVYPEDPAHQLIKRLPKEMTYYVFPRQAILTGRYNETPPVFDVTDIDMVPEVATAYIRQVRMRDIWQYLATKEG